MNTNLSIVEEIVRSKPPTSVVPREFFVAWQGVPTLAYKGFSVTLLEVKDEIRKAVPSLGEEKPGSLWPKTTLGALRDGVTLSWKEAFVLREICTLVSQEEIGDAPPPFQVTRLSVVLFQCRSLEKRLVTYPIGLVAGR